MDEWKSARNLLEKNPREEILDKLQISYRGLDKLEKEMFLDIVFFFNGEYLDFIIHKLEGLGYDPIINIKVLVDKSLITIEYFNNLEVHDLLQKMGQKIVHDECAEPGERSRLCHDKDVIHILKNDTGTNAIRGIVLKLPLQKQDRLSVEAFSKMKKLKTLQIVLNKPRDFCYSLRTNLEWHGNPSNFMLNNELCIMEWWGYPLVSLPTNFQSDNLVELIMTYSCIKQLWDGRKSFDKLKRICLNHSKNLIETPDLSGVPNLEQLELQYCTSLCKVHPSIGFLKRLKGLYLEGCTCLKRLPDEMISLSSLVRLDISHCSRLEEISKYMISGMNCLKYLLVGGSATMEFPIGSEPYRLLIPNSFSSLSSLIKLDLSYRNLSDGAIPSDLSCLSSLSNLNLSGNKFTRIPYSAWQLSNLYKVDLSYCNLLDGAIPNDLSCLSSLHCLNLSGNKFMRIPDSVGQLSHLYNLFLDDCIWLQVLPKLPLQLMELGVRNCPSLRLFCNKQTEMWRRTSDEKLRSIDCSFVQAYIDYDGKPFKILHLHPQSPIWTDRSHRRHDDLYPEESEECYDVFTSEVACGPTLVGSGIPEWFNVKSTNSFGTIQLHSYLGSDDYSEGYALFIVYEFHEPHSSHPRKSRKVKVDERKGNSNSTTFNGSNRNFPYFVCQFQANGVDVKKPLVLCAPGVPSVGPNGFWVYLTFEWFGWFDARRVDENWRSFEASITTGSLNVELKECGARLVRDRNDYSELYQLLNTISPPPAFGLQSYENLFSLLHEEFFVNGPIIIKSNVVASRINWVGYLLERKKKQKV